MGEDVVAEIAAVLRELLVGERLVAAHELAGHARARAALAQTVLHRLYLHKWISGLAIPVMTALTATMFPLFFWLLVPLALMLLIDLWTLNSQVSEFNLRHQNPSVVPQPA